MLSLYRIRLKLLIKVIKIFLFIPEKQQIFDTKCININGLKIWYRLTKQNMPTLIFLHGWSQTKEVWNNILPAFKKFTIFAVDLPGFGQSALPKTTYTIDNYAVILKKIINKMHIDKCTIIAHSFGGKIAVKYAAKNPKRLEKLVLYSTNLHFSKTPFIIRVISSTFFKKFVHVYLNLLKKSQKRFDMLLQIYINTHKNIVFIHDIKRIKQPTLLIAGKYDFITPPKCAFETNRLLINSRVVLFDNSTHFAHLEEKEKFINELSIFLES